MTAADQIAAINRSRFARRIRPTKRGRRYATLLPRDGRQDMWRALETVQRTLAPTREFWMTAKGKKALSTYMLDRGKIRVWVAPYRCADR